MNQLEKILQKYAYYGDEYPFREVDLDAILEVDNLERIGKGMNTRVFKLRDHDWVIKEGRWDLDAKIVKNINVKLPPKMTENFLKIFKMSFLPEPEEIKRQYSLYMEMVNFLGYFKEDSSYYHPDISKIFDTQNRLRKTLSDYVDPVCESYNLNHLKSDLYEIVRSENAYKNFLPKEYVIYGDSFSKQNKGKKTYHIFQEYIDGQLLHDIKLEEMSSSVREQIITIAYLVLLMSLSRDLIPDLRPRYFLTELTDWFFNTDNIMVKGDRVCFIDTRWMWGLKDNVVKRGGIIPELTIESIKLFLEKALSNG